MLKDKSELMIQLSYNCNINCIHCAYGSNRRSPTLTLKQIENFLSRHSPKIIKISGGEPTISPIFGDTIKICKKTGAKVVSFTNGLSSPTINPDFYWVSLYGRKKTHNRITNFNGYDNVIKFIQTHNVEYINSPVFSFSQMSELKELSHELNIPLRITQLLPHGTPHKTLTLKEQQQIIYDLNLNNSNNWITCSLGFEPPRCLKKACLKPDNTETICTYIIHGLKCPFSIYKRREKNNDKNSY